MRCCVVKLIAFSSGIHRQSSATSIHHTISRDDKGPSSKRVYLLGCHLRHHRYLGRQPRKGQSDTFPQLVSDGFDAQFRTGHARISRVCIGYFEHRDSAPSSSYGYLSLQAAVFRQRVTPSFSQQHRRVRN